MSPQGPCLRKLKVARRICCWFQPTPKHRALGSLCLWEGRNLILRSATYHTQVCFTWTIIHFSPLFIMFHFPSSTKPLPTPSLCPHSLFKRPSHLHINQSWVQSMMETFPFCNNVLQLKSVLTTFTSVWLCLLFEGEHSDITAIVSGTLDHVWWCSRLPAVKRSCCHWRRYRELVFFFFLESCGAFRYQVRYIKYILYQWI